jgi:ketosteroid isomerase-like protein
MTTNRRTLAVLTTATLLGAGLFTGSQAQAQAGDDRQAVERQVEALRRLMINPDRAALEKIFADQLTYGHSDGRVNTKQEYIDALVERRSAFHSITLSKQTIAVSGDVAVVRHHFDADAVSNGKPGHPSIEVLQVWQKQGGEWRLLVRQAH